MNRNIGLGELIDAGRVREAQNQHHAKVRQGPEQLIEVKVDTKNLEASPSDPGSHESLPHRRHSSERSAVENIQTRHVALDVQMVPSDRWDGIRLRSGGARSLALAGLFSNVGHIGIKGYAAAQRV